MAGPRAPSPESRVPSWDDMVLVGRIVRTHGLRGDVVVEPETDFVEERFQQGAAVWMSSAGAPERLTIRSARLQGGRPVIGLDGFDRIEAVEPLVGRELRVPEEALRPLAEGVYYHHQLVGCMVETMSGRTIGPVARVDGGSSGSLLAVEGARGEILIPLVAEICIEIDVGTRRIRIEPPEGLLELNTRSKGKGQKSKVKTWP